MSQIGLDIDYRDKDFVVGIIERIHATFDIKWLRLFISPTGRGYHIKFSINSDITTREMIRIRKKFGDDPNRISMVGGVYRDVLFDIKKVNGINYRSVEIDPDEFVRSGKEVLV